MVTAFNELKYEAEELGRDVMLLHAGDAITGSLYYTLFEGDADAAMMSHICFDAFVPGNHVSFALLYTCLLSLVSCSLLSYIPIIQFYHTLNLPGVRPW